MSKLGIRRLRTGVWLGAWVLLQACASDPLESPLPGILDAERETALVAAILGPDGGTLQVQSGPYAGTLLEVPAGALSGDAVFSISATDTVSSGLGYVPVSDVARFYSTAVQFFVPLTLALPVRPGAVEPGAEAHLVLLSRREGVYRPVGGAVFDGQRIRALVSDLGDHGAAVSTGGPVLDDDMVTETRCSFIAGSVSMNQAISGARNRLLLEATWFPDPKLHTVGSTSVNACGYSTTWKTRWYSTGAGSRTAEIEYSISGSSNPKFTDGLPCAFSSMRAMEPTTNSTGLSDDFYERLAEAPQQLTLSTLSCEDNPSVIPQRLRLAETSTGEWAVYSPDGIFIDGSY